MDFRKDTTLYDVYTTKTAKIIRGPFPPLQLIGVIFRQSRLLYHLPPLILQILDLTTANKEENNPCYKTS